MSNAIVVAALLGAVAFMYFGPAVTEALLNGLRSARSSGMSMLHAAHFDQAVRPSRWERRAMHSRLDGLWALAADERGSITTGSFKGRSIGDMRRDPRPIAGGDGNDINDLRQERAKRAKEARDILDDAQEAGRDLTAEEEQNFDRLMDEADKLEERIAREEKLREQERRVEDDPEPTDRNTDPGNEDPKEETLRAFRHWVRDGLGALPEAEVRALNMGSDPEGGYLVAPQQFVEALLKAVDDTVDIRNLATTQTLTEGESLGVPTLDTDLADAEWTAEIATGSQDDALRFGKRELRPHPLAKRVLVSRTLLRRAALDPESIVRDRLAYKFGVSAEKAYMTGDGNQKPLGLFVASSQGISTSRDSDIPHTAGVLDSAAGAAADALIDAKYTLKSQYLRLARWLFHRDLIAGIRKLKDGNDQYIWQPGLAGDRPDTILDVPYTVNEFVPNTISDNSYVGMIGDFSFYWIADALDMEIQRLIELYAETNQVGFIGRLETDGMPTLEEPFVRLKAV
jgi:HK97 family phage major capsid protein